MKSNLLLCAAMALLMTGCSDSNDIAEKEEINEQQSQSSDDQTDAKDKNKNENETEPKQRLTSKEII